MSELSLEVRGPLSLTLVDGTVVVVPQWSLEGFTYPDEVDVPPKEALLSIPFQGVDIQFPVRLTARPGSRRLQFDGLTGRQRETLAIFYRSLLSGRMAATEEIITSLDTPVDLVPMGETEEEEAVGRPKTAPRALRAILSLGVYLLLAGLVFWALGSGIYGKLAHVEIRNARIEAPLTRHHAPAAAYVKSIEVAPGTAVEVGGVLLRLTTSEGEAALAGIRTQINRTEARLSEARHRLAELEARIAAARAAIRRRLGEGAAPEEEIPVPQALAMQQADALRVRDALKDELRLLRSARGRLRAGTDALIIRADAPGIVTEILVMQGQYVARATPVVETEADLPRQARGWVDQSLAAALAPEQHVRVQAQLPEGRRVLTGRVTALEAGIDPALSPEFGMLVSVGFPDMDLDRTRAELPHLMPVRLRAERAWSQDLSGWWGSLKRRVGAVVGG